VTARFDGGRLTSDGGGVLLREADARIGLLSRLASCFVDYRNPASVEHTVRDLVSQRVYGLALGYEDLNDHHRIRDDATLALLVGKRDLTGEDRVRLRDKGHPLASASGLNRLELSVPETAATDRYKRIAAETKRMDALFTSLFLEAREEVPEEIVLDIDATDDPLHGTREGRFFNGYYRSCCYLPLYIFCGKHLLLARLRTSDRDAADGTVRELAPIIERIRSAWPETRIILRGDSGFCRDRIMVWCEQHGVDYVVGLPGNARLTERIEPALQEARKMFEATGEPARQFRQFSYQTRTSWSRRRRVVAKAEWLAKGENPRFVVTSLAPDRVDKQQLPRASVLRPRRGGEPHQGATGALPRPHQHPVDRRQSAPALLLLFRLRAARRHAQTGAGGYAECPTAVRHPAAPLLQDRCLPADHPSPRLDRAVVRASLADRLRRGSRESREEAPLPPASLRTAGRPHPTTSRLTPKTGEVHPV